METPISNSELYHMLVEKGYSANITKKNNSKAVRFNGKYSTKESKEKVQASYRLEWTDDEIKRDIASKLLVWYGLRIKTVLDY